MPSVVAIDVALLPPTSIGRRCRVLNARLASPPKGFRFDETHLPHVTLVQEFVRQDRLPSLIAQIGEALDDQAPLRLRTTGLAHGPSATTLTLAPEPALEALHRMLADTVHPLAEPANSDAFANDDSPPRPADVEWVRSFRTAASYRHFAPHITLGIGRLDAAVPSWRFVARRVALCHLGRFCTCRSILTSWTLTAAS